MKKNLSFTLISFFFWVQFQNLPFNYMFKEKVELIGKKIGWLMEIDLIREGTFNKVSLWGWKSKLM